MKLAYEISVIIPAYNAEKFIVETLESVYVQTFLPYEVIVVDDGSTDSTAKVIEQKFPQVKLLQQKNAGVSSARNLALKNATGKYIAFLDSDDLWLPNKLENQILALSQHPESDVILCDESLFDESGIYQDSVVKKLTIHNEFQQGIAVLKRPLTCLFKQSFVSTSGVLVKKSLVDQIGFFSEDLSIGEDREYWIKMALNSSIVFINQPLVHKRENHGSNLSQISRLKLARGLFQVISGFDNANVRKRLREEGSNDNVIFADNYKKYAEFFWHGEKYPESKRSYELARLNGALLDIKSFSSIYLPTSLIRMLRK